MKTKCEVYSRVVGYLRPVEQWNEGKAEEFKDRVVFETGGNDSEQSKAERIQNGSKDKKKASK